MYKKLFLLTILVVGGIMFFGVGEASAHCDTLSGPVVSAGRVALETNNPVPAMAWVKPEDEDKIRRAFEKARAARKAGGAAKEKAEMEFFAELVRVHREGEGAKYEGLKPADTDLGPIIPLADQAYETGSYEELSAALKAEIDRAVALRIEQARHLKAAEGNDVEKSREAVNAYVAYVHWTEGLHNMIANAEHHEEHETTKHEAEDHSSGHSFWHRLFARFRG